MDSNVLTKAQKDEQFEELLNAVKDSIKHLSCYDIEVSISYATPNFPNEFYEINVITAGLFTCVALKNLVDVGEKFYPMLKYYGIVPMERPYIMFQFCL